MKTITVITALIILGACVPNTPQNNPHTTVVSTQGTKLTKVQMRQAAAAVGSKLRDPRSAQYGNVAGAILTYGDGSKRLAACGLVNGKNAYGAYVGNSMYLVMYADRGGAVAIMKAELVCRKYGIM